MQENTPITDAFKATFENLELSQPKKMLNATKHLANNQTTAILTLMCSNLATLEYKEESNQRLLAKLKECTVFMVFLHASITQKYAIDSMMELEEKCLSIITKKNNDYRGGDNDTFANFKLSEAYGVSPRTAVLIRISDKLQRIKTFNEKGELQVKDEPVQDAIIDIINYLAIYYGLYLEETPAKPKLKNDG